MFNDSVKIINPTTDLTIYEHEQTHNYALGMLIDIYCFIFIYALKEIDI